MSDFTKIILYGASAGSFLAMITSRISYPDSDIWIMSGFLAVLSLLITKKWGDMETVDMLIIFIVALPVIFYACTKLYDKLNDWETVTK